MRAQPPAPFRLAGELAVGPKTVFPDDAHKDFCQRTVAGLPAGACPCLTHCAAPTLLLWCLALPVAHACERGAEGTRKGHVQGETMGQDIFDLIVVLTLAFFAGRGYLNGFVGEVAGIVSLLGGFWAAHTYHYLLSPHLTLISDPGWRTIAA